jgi:hypothetical protein
LSNWNFRGALSTYVSFKSLVGSMQLQWHGTYCDFSLTRVRWMGKWAGNIIYQKPRWFFFICYLPEDQRSCVVRGGGHRSSRDYSIPTVEYQSVCPIVGIVSPPPPPPLKVSMSPPFDISGKISDTAIIGLRVLQ